MKEYITRSLSWSRCPTLYLNPSRVQSWSEGFLLFDPFHADRRSNTTSPTIPIMIQCPLMRSMRSLPLPVSSICSYPLSIVHGWRCKCSEFDDPHSVPQPPPNAYPGPAGPVPQPGPTTIPMYVYTVPPEQDPRAICDRIGHQEVWHFGTAGVSTIIVNIKVKRSLTEGS